MVLMEALDVGWPEKKFSINFSKAKTQTQNCAWSYIILLIIIICLLMENKSLSLKPTINKLILQVSFVSELYLMDLVLH